MDNTKEITIEVLGENHRQLKQIARDISDLLYPLPCTENIILRFKPGRPSFELVVDRNKLAAWGGDSQMINKALWSAIRGPISTKFIENHQEMDVRVKLEDNSLSNIDEVLDYRIIPRDDVMFPLKEVVSLKRTRDETRVWRKNRQRLVSLTLRRGDTGYSESLRQIEDRLKHYRFPRGYSYTFHGNVREYNEARISLLLSVVVALFLLYALLACIYQDVIIPLYIIALIPFLLAGVVVIHFVLGWSFSLSTYIGIMLLLGLGVNNGILLVDQISQSKGIRPSLAANAASGLQEHILRACKSRFNIILLTTATTLLGLIPTMFMEEEGSHFYKPIALTLFSGLSFSTLITMITLPILLNRK